MLSRCLIIGVTINSAHGNDILLPTFNEGCDINLEAHISTYIVVNLFMIYINVAFIVNCAKVKNYIKSVVFNINSFKIPNTVKIICVTDTGKNAFRAEWNYDFRVKMLSFVEFSIAPANTAVKLKFPFSI
mgnify:CR=1 FL=1